MKRIEFFLFCAMIVISVIVLALAGFGIVALGFSSICAIFGMKNSEVIKIIVMTACFLILMITVFGYKKGEN